MTVIFQQFRDNLLFWTQLASIFNISRAERGQKSAQVFAVIWRAKRQEAEVIGGERSPLGYQLLATCSAKALF